jgi:GNAT superfamily N-acetyltransferase
VLFSDAITIQPFDQGTAVEVSALVRQVFDEHVAPSFGPEGVAEMHRHVAPEAITDRARTHSTFVAWQQGQPVGVIEVRDADHVSMLFVRTSHMGLGIASALLARAEEACRAAGRPKMTVHSSLNAQTFYERLGFVARSEPQHVHGFSFLSMEKDI